MKQQFKNSAVIKVIFENFWEDFDCDNNFLTRLFVNSEYQVAKSKREEWESSVRVVSHFESIPSNHEILKRAVKHYVAIQIGKQKKEKPFKNISQESVIFYTGENFRPPTTNAFSISHDLDDYGGTNLYYPYLFDHLLMAKLGQKDHIYGDVIEFNYLVDKRDLSAIPPKLSSIFFSNDVPLRRRLIDLMKKGGEVDVFGKVSGEYVSNRSILAGQYKFVLCPENDHFPGYVTEKILHAYAMGAVPVYWGGLTLEQGLNPRAFIHLDPTSNLNSQISDIHSMSDERYKEIYEQPLFLHEPNWTRIQKTILDWIEILKRETNEAK